MVAKVSLDEINDIDVYNFIDHGKRGVIRMASNRWTVVNNHYLEDHDALQRYVAPTLF